MKSSPLNESNKNDEYQRIKFKENKNDLDMAAKAEKWMGVLVNKEFDNKSHMGSVVNYCGETKLFEIDYENDVSEEVDYQELQKIVAPPPLVCEYLERINPSEMEKENKKRQQQEDSWVPVHPRYPTTFQQQVKPKKRKCKEKLAVVLHPLATYLWHLERQRGMPIFTIISELSNPYNAPSKVQHPDNCLEDATMKSSPLNESNKNDEYQRIKFKENKNNLDIAAKAEKWMRVLINKEFDNKSHMIDYENDVSEEVDYQELQKIVAPPPLVCEYLERINPR
ncbi:hypothetical protein CXB51_027598 [Gossypium anomalum]|uniref:PTM/DIR17-like Tudor domain-containing protein n=1 Tax=Gossypium anomalum TaxID=47600 RepID=A0A8J6CNU9_9ROSI|nr:hypothetical protein CXB51_027598 [Gossypium anomalum]